MSDSAELARAYRDGEVAAVVERLLEVSEERLLRAVAAMLAVPTPREMYPQTSEQYRERLLTAGLAALRGPR